jgi:hypothetical protein
MKNTVMKLASVALFGLAACAGDGDVVEAQDKPGVTLTCPEGQVAFDFSRFPNAQSTEGLSQLVDGGVPPFKYAPPNAVVINSATCVALDGGTNLDGYTDRNGNLIKGNWTNAVSESCAGRGDCNYSATDCAFNLFVSWSCKDTPGTVKNNFCKLEAGTNCIVQMTCDQPAPKPQPVQARVECVPKNCNVSQKRDANMQCVDDIARTEELIEDMSIELTTKRFSLVRESVLGITDPSTGFPRGYIDVVGESDIPRLNLPQRFNIPQSHTPDTFSKALSQEYDTLVADAIYDLKTEFVFRPKVGGGTTLPKGNLDIWLADEYVKKSKCTGPNCAVDENAFRCLVASIDLSKYETSSPRGDGLFSVAINERLIIPRDCRTRGSLYYQSVGILSRRLGFKDAVAFTNAYRLKNTRFHASYDMSGKVILLNTRANPERLTRCATNPVDFYYDVAAQTHNRYEYYMQRDINALQKKAAPTFDPFLKSYGLSDDTANVTEATLALIGMNEVRPKRIEQKIRATGAARGFIRIDADWWLHADRHGTWASRFRSGNAATSAMMKAYLVPLDSNGALKSVELELGTQRLTDSNAYGQTANLKYQINEDLRSKFMQKNGEFEVTKAGRNFKIKACVVLGDNPATRKLGSFRDIYTLEMKEADRCRVSAMPMVLKLDPAVTPIEPPEFSNGLAESNPQGAGDNRMSQQSEQDNDIECVDSGNPVVHTCRSRFRNSLAQIGPGSLFENDVSTVNVDNQKASSTKDTKFFSYTVLDEEENRNFSLTTPKLTFTVEPAWDTIAMALNRTIPGARVESESYGGGSVQGGVKGLSLGFEIKVPVRYGPVQGDVVFGFSVGAGVEVKLTYEYFPNFGAVSCTQGGAECDLLYSLQTPMSLQEAVSTCTANGGRLADMTSNVEVARLRALAPTGSIWAGAQVANEYISNECRNGWRAENCSPRHKTAMRWLSTDEDFATSLSLGSYTKIPGELFEGNQAVTLGANSYGARQGVILANGNALNLVSVDDRYASVCKRRSSASASKHQLSAEIELIFAAGVSLAFCTPSADFGVCLEGSFNLFEATLTPSVTYSHVNLVDGLMRGTQSNITFNLDWGATILSGELAVRVIFGKWFTFKYPLVSFSGLQIGKGTLFSREVPIKEDFK